MDAYCNKTMSKCKVIHFGDGSKELPEETHLSTEGKKKKKVY